MVIPKTTFFLSLTVLVVLLLNTFGYWWLFSAKLGVVFVFPASMAWAGNYLASKNEDAKDKRFWQMLFIRVTAGIVLLGFVVLRQDEIDHRNELEKQRANTKDDVMSALLQYNQEHPGKPVPKEAVNSVLAAASGGHTKPSKKDDPQKSPIQPVPADLIKRQRTLPTDWQYRTDQLALQQEHFPEDHQPP